MDVQQTQSERDEFFYVPIHALQAVVHDGELLRLYFWLLAHYQPNKSTTTVSLAFFRWPRKTLHDRLKKLESLRLILLRRRKEKVVITIPDPFTDGVADE